MQRLDRLQHLQSVETRALQPNIEKNEMRPPGGDGGQGLVGVLGDAGSIALVAQNAGDQFPDVRFVVDDENVARHHAPLFSTREDCSLLTAFSANSAGAIGSSMRTRAPLPSGASSSSSLPP